MITRDARLRLAACIGAAALLQIDGTIVTVALPTVGHDLDVNSHRLSGVLTAYFIAYGVMLFRAVPSWTASVAGERRSPGSRCLRPGP